MWVHENGFRVLDLFGSRENVKGKRVFISEGLCLCERKEFSYYVFV